MTADLRPVTSGDTPATPGGWPMVTVVIPCLNEAEHIARCLRSLVEGAYSLDRLEVLVVDGGSTDGCQASVEAFARRWPCIRLLHNPRRTQAVASNIGIAAARGSAVLKLDAHAEYSADYVRECVRSLVETGADVVGGRIETRPRRTTGLGVAIAVGMSEQLGVGASMFRVVKDGAQDPRWVDTVPFACYRRDVFDRVGGFNEALDRSEDIEFHQRLHRHGCRTLFVPSIVSYYYARSDYKAFALHAFSNGRWAVLPARFGAGLVVSVRHLVPLVAVALGFGLAAMSLTVATASVLLTALAVVYLLMVLGVSVQASVRLGRADLLALLPVVFITLHVGYGLGSLAGCLEVFAASVVGWWRAESTGRL